MPRLDLSGLDGPALSSFTGAAPTAPLAQFEEDPENPRTEFDDVDFDAFVEDIRQRGILQPLVVRRTDNGKLRLRFGARRLRAAQRLKLDAIPYIVTEDDRQFDGYAQVSENEQRKDLEPLELARFIAKRVAAGEAKGAIAGKLGVHGNDVTYLLCLIDAPPLIEELYACGKCRSPQFLYRLRRMFDKQPDLVTSRVEALDSITRANLDQISAEIEAPKGRAESETGREPTAVKAARPQSTPAPTGKDPGRIKKPLLLGRHAGRDVVLLLSKRPSSAGLVFVRYEDSGADAEVPCADMTILLLTDSNG
jgi:ParB family chromosome partitioning protein